MGESVRAMVQTGAGKLELQRFDRPEIGDNDGLLRVEACGICGTDTETYRGAIPINYPVIPGHEPVGRIEEIGSRAAQRWGLEAGDRVVVQAEFGCGRCRGCMDDRTCAVSPGTYGFMPTDMPPSLWGGYAEMLYLPPGAVPHKISKHVEPCIAALYNPLGAGFAWAVKAPGLQCGDTIAVLGPGQRGLACVIAASAAGAERIFVTGLGSRDAHKLSLATRLGAHVAIDVEAEDALERITEETGGRGVDVVVDTTPHATQPVIDAVQMARPGGTIVLAGIKGRGGIPAFPSDDVAMRYQTIKGVRAVDYHSFQRAVRLIESGSVPVHELHTHRFPLEAAAEAVLSLTEPRDRPVIAVSIEP